MRITRRRMVQAAGAAAALAAADGAGLGRGLVPVAEAAPAAGDDAAKGVTWGKAPCRLCGTGCGTRVAVRDGRVVAVTGDPDCGVNKGILCAKGYMLPGMLAGGDRILHPMVRRGDRYERISWDEALDLVASKVKETLAAKGPQGVAFYGSGQSTIPEGYAMNKWFKGGLRSNNVEANARLCMASAVVGFMTTFGADEPMGCYDDIDHADVFVLWGNNMAEAHPVLYSRVLERKLRHPAAKILEIATRRTQTSDFADRVILMRPQGDLAIANGICRWLLAEGRHDAAFVKDHCVFVTGKQSIGYGLEDKFAFADEEKAVSFDEYRAMVEPYTPEKVTELAGIPKEDFLALCAAFGDPALRVISFWCMGVNQHVRGSWMNNLIYDVHLLSGKIGVPGSTPFSLTGQPTACGTVREVGTLSHGLPGGRVVMNPEHRRQVEKHWGIAEGTIADKPGLHTVEMFRALDRGDVTFMWVQTTNPFQSMPKLTRYRDGKRKKRDATFLVVSDVYPTETTALADLILPSAMWVEKEGAFGNSERRTQQWDRLAEAPGEARPDVWQIVEVARRTGCGHLFPDPKPGESLEKSLFEDYRALTLGNGKDIADWETLRTVPGLRWPVVNGKETRWRYVPEHDPYAKKGVRIDFYGNAKNGGKAKVIFRPWEPPAESPDAEYPFWFSTGRVLEHWHTGSMTRRARDLHRAMPRAYCEIHPDDAAALGVTNGARVRLTSRRGTLVIEAAIARRGAVQKGHLFVPFFDESLPANDLTIDACCPMSKEPDYKKCAVRVEKV